MRFLWSVKTCTGKGEGVLGRRYYSFVQQERMTGKGKSKDANLYWSWSGGGWHQMHTLKCR